MGRPHGGKLGRPNHFLVARMILVYLKKKQLFFSYEHKIAQECLTCSDAPLHYSNIHAIVWRLLKTWNHRARGLLSLGEGRARGIRRQNESEWIPVPWEELEILQSCINPSKWVCQFTCRSCVWSLLCLIGSLFGLTSNFQRKHQISATLPLCVGNPPVTGWFRSDKDLSHRWFETPWRSCDVTVLWCPVCACIHIDTQILR